MAVIQRVTKRLSDGSEVFNVKVWDDGSRAVEFQCITEADADQFIRVLSVAIDNHTNEVAELEEAE